MRKLPQLDVNSFLRISKAPKKLFNCKLASFNFYPKEKITLCLLILLPSLIFIEI